ncbi:hypothetical protein JW968_00885 [Candidatus Woesearchaeota archaeon]|nr:hypothetical protein [Candidatus Woesearchaeota archaeon]
MNILIVYDGIVLKKVADAMMQSLRSVKGNSMSISEKPIDKVSDRDITSADLFLIGSDTVNWGASNKVMGFLSYIRGKNVQFKAGAAFGLRLKHTLAGSASKRIEKFMRMIRLNVVAKHLDLFEDDHGKLDAGELEKAKAYAKYIWMY